MGQLTGHADFPKDLDSSVVLFLLPSIIHCLAQICQTTSWTVPSPGETGLDKTIVLYPLC